jgi:hypothetical protein
VSGSHRLALPWRTIVPKGLREVGRRERTALADDPFEPGAPGRVRFDGIHVARGGESGLHELDRMVHEVGAEQRSLAVRVDREHLVPGCVPGRVFEPELVRHGERGVRELDDARAFERFEGNGEDLPILLIGGVRHQVPVGAVDHVARVREVRRSGVADVPPDVIVVDVADQDELDGERIDAQLGELDREAAGDPAPPERGSRCGTDPRIHQEASPIDTHGVLVDVDSPSAVLGEDLRMALTRFAPTMLVYVGVRAGPGRARGHDGVAEGDDLDPADPDRAVRH